jgi:CheY-like chemotaxis protein
MIIACLSIVRTNLAKLLVREGIVSIEQIKEAVESGKESGYDLGESLAALGYVKEQQLVEFLSKEYGVPSMDIDGCETDRSVIGLIPRDTALEKFLVPISVEGADLTIAVSDPSNILMLDDLGFITGKNIKPVVASERSIRNKLAEYYGESEAAGPRSDEEGSGGTGSQEGSNTSYLFTDKKSPPADDLIRELERYRIDRPSDEDVSGAEETRSSAGTGFDFMEGPGPEAIDDNKGQDIKPEPDFVFDFTDEKGRDADLPFSPPGEGIVLEEENIGREEDTDVYGAQAGSGGFESPLLEAGNGFEAGPVAEDNGSNTGPELLTDNEPAGVDMENPDPHPDAQLNESIGESAREPVDSEQVSDGAFKQSGESDTHSRGDGFSPSHEVPSPAAHLMNGAEPDGHDNGMKENRGSVLIVDVSPTVRKIMRISLERAGYKVVSASDGMQALARLNEAIPDLIFVDIRLPHMDGYQLCKVIKSHGLTKEVPVVMLTGKSGVLDKMKIKMAGASDLITKPFGSADLVGAVEKYAG